MNLPFEAVYILTSNATRARLPHVLQQIAALELDKHVKINVTYSPTSKIIRDLFVHSGVLKSSIYMTRPYTTWCTFGHYLIQHDAIDRRYSSILVLEDDAVFINNKDILYDYFINVPNDFNIINLEWHEDPRSYYYKSGRFTEYVEKNRNLKFIPHDTDASFLIRGSGAYMANTVGLNYLIRTVDNCSPLVNKTPFAAIDNFFDPGFIKDSGIKAYLSNPVLVVQDIGCGGREFDVTRYNPALNKNEFDHANYIWDFNRTI